MMWISVCKSVAVSCKAIDGAERLEHNLLRITTQHLHDGCLVHLMGGERRGRCLTQHHPLLAQSP